jgi:hypothetical protein
MDFVGNLLFTPVEDKGGVSRDVSYEGILAVGYLLEG